MNSVAAAAGVPVSAIFLVVCVLWEREAVERAHYRRAGEDVVDLAAAIRHLGVGVLLAMAFPARASEPACVSAASTVGADARTALRAQLQIETRKRGRPERWTPEPCAPGHLRLHLEEAGSGTLHFPEGATAAVLSEEADGLAAVIVERLAAADAGPTAAVPLLGAAAIGVGNRPPGRRFVWTLGAGLEVLNQSARTFAGPVVTVRRELGRPWAELGGDIGLGAVMREEVFGTSPESDAMQPSTAHFLGTARLGPRFGPVRLRAGGGMGVRWQPVQHVDTVGLIAELERTDKTVEELEGDYLYLAQIGVPLLALNAEVSVDLAPRVRATLCGGLESYLQLNESIDTSPLATIVHGTGPANGFESHLAVELRL